MGKSWSLEQNDGWNKMMDQYHSVIKNTLDPRLVILNVHGGIRDYKFMRYGLASHEWMMAIFVLQIGQRL